jgi:alpha-L-arabinofuranosidase
MKKNLLLSSLFIAATISVLAQTQLVVNVKTSGSVINKNIYGHFAEHLGNCIYGGFYVGDTSKIPNTNGVRNDIITALKKLKIPNLRWPGGCFADTYHWKDGIGPKDKRPSMVNTWWGGVTEDNSFGTHDFLDMCEQLGAEPYISGNVGSGTVQELVQWGQYVSFAGKSPMSDLRKKNGRENPWHVKYWGMGNEAWGCGGNMTAEYYANLYKQYATFMTDWDNTSHIFRVASGANSSDYHWTEVMMRDIPRKMLEAVALHYYSVINWSKKSSAANFTSSEYFTTMKRAWRMEELVTKHSAIMDKYDSTKKVALVVDEWGGWYDVEPGTNPGFLFQQNTMRDAMIAGVTLNIFNNHCDRVRMANIAQTINVLQAVILTDKEKMILTPTYYVMEMYNVHQDATLLPITITGSNYIMSNDTIPAISVSASKDKSGTVHISLVNIDDAKSQAVSADLSSISYTQVSGRILVSPHIQDHNTFDEPEKVKPVPFTGFKKGGDHLSITLPPASVVVLSLN